VNGWRTAEIPHVTYWSTFAAQVQRHFWPRFGVPSPNGCRLPDMHPFSGFIIVTVDVQLLPRKTGFQISSPTVIAMIAADLQ
jgi:hypothetical protein